MRTTSATGRLLVKNNGPVQSITDIRNRKVATTSGSIYDRWLKRCHTSTEVTVTDSFTNALLAFNQGRADALMWDDTVLVGVAAADQSAKLTNDTFLALPYGIGIKQGNIALKRWVDSRLELMRKKDTLHVDPQEQRAGAVRHRLLEEHPPAEQHVRVRAGGRPERGHRLLETDDRTTTTTGSGRDNAAASSSCR